MFTLTKDGNLCKDGKETKPEMTVQEFMEAFNVSEEAFDVSKDGNVKTYNVQDTFYDIPSELEFSFVEDEILDIEIVISTEPFLDKCGEDDDIQDIQREACLEVIEKDIKYKEKETGGKRHVMYITKNTEIDLVQYVMEAELSIKIDYLILTGDK